MSQSNDLDEAEGHNRTSPVEASTATSAADPLATLSEMCTQQTILTERVSNLEALIDQDSGNGTDILAEKVVKMVKNDVKDVTDKFVLNLEFPKTCRDYITRGVRQTGYQYIDPDGFDHGEGPFMALCRFNGTDLITEIKHDSMESFEVQPCDGVGCYHKTISYEGTLHQMTNLISASQSCEQSIQVISTVFI